jgi:hypothetical protein
MRVRVRVRVRFRIGLGFSSICIKTVAFIKLIACGLISLLLVLKFNERLDEWETDLENVRCRSACSLHTFMI